MFYYMHVGGAPAHSGSCKHQKIHQIYTTYAVSVCREVWRDTQRVPGPSKIASFWPVSAIFVAETGQKRGDLGGGCTAPQPPPRKSSHLCDISSACHRSLFSRAPPYYWPTHAW